MEQHRLSGAQEEALNGSAQWRGPERTERIVQA